ncbi:MAG: hypothetical protein J4F43_09655 [Dehalococcoidia bacterium]|nr:hypothetical protein [Dehalococcoidia bacterium]
MVHDNGQGSALRDLRLLEGERIEDRFAPDTGSVPETPERGPLLVLTSHRIISFNDADGNKGVSAAAIAELQGVSVKANTRGLRDLVQGLFLLLGGILAYIVLGYILDGITVALALGAAIAFVGVLFIGKYLIWEEDGSVTFIAGGWQTSFSYQNGRAVSDLYGLIDRCFQLKLQTGDPAVAHQPETEPTEPEEAPAPAPFPAAHANADGEADATPAAAAPPNPQREAALPPAGLLNAPESESPPAEAPPVAAYRSEQGPD